MVVALFSLLLLLLLRHFAQSMKLVLANHQQLILIASNCILNYKNATHLILNFLTLISNKRLRAVLHLRTLHRLGALVLIVFVL